MPPLTGIAVNDAVVPLQIEVPAKVIDTEGAIIGVAYSSKGKCSP